MKNQLSLNHVRPLILVGSIATLLVSHSAQAQTASGWRGNTSSDFQTATNWDNGFGSNFNLFVGQAWHNAGRTGSTTLNNASAYSGYRLNFENITGGANQTFTVQGSPISLFDFGGVSPAVINSSSVNQIINGSLVLDAGGSAASLVQANGASGGNLTFGGTVSLAGTNQLRISGANSNTITFSNVISATGANSVVANQGSSGTTTIFNAANTYSGDTFVDSGTLQFGTAASSAGSANNSILRVGQSGVDTPTATINLATTTGGVNVGSTIVIRPTAIATTQARTLSSSNTSGINTFSGAIAMDAAATVTSTNAGGTLALTGATLELKTFALALNGSGNTTVSNVINSTGAGNALSKSGAGTVRLSGNNTYSGLTTVSGIGTLILSGDNTGATGGVTLSAGSGGSSNIPKLHINSATALGTGTLVFAGGLATDTVQIDNSSGSSVTLSTNNALDIRRDFTFVGSSSLNLGNGGVTTSNASRTFTIAANTLTLGGVITDAGLVRAITKNGVGTLSFGSSNTYSGTTSVNPGTLIGTANTGTPFGTGANTVANGTLALAPSGSGSSVALTGGTVASGTLFTFGAGARFSLDKGSQTSLTYTFGGTGAAFSRAATGSLILSTTAISNLGTASGTGERFIINGTAPTTVNGLVSGLVGQDRSANNAGDFLTYGANGFTLGAYTSTNTFANTATDVVNITTSGVSTGTVAAYALRVNGNTLTNTGTITLGSTSVNQLILNGGTISGGTITTPSTTETLIYVSSLGGTISSALNSGASSVGTAVSGPGSLDLSGSAGNGFTAGLRVYGSTVIANNDNQLGGSTSTISLFGGTLQTSGTFALGTTAQRNITLGAGQGNTGATFNVTSGTTTFTSATSKVFSGSGSLTKTGTGTLALTGAVTNTYSGATIIAANGGTLSVDSGAAGGNRIGSTSSITVNSNGTLLFAQTGTASTDRVNNAATVTLSGGTLNLGGVSEGTAGTTGIGALTLTSTSTINFGTTGTGNLIQFAGLGTHTASTVLQITNWEGTPGSASGTDRLLFAGTSSSFTSLYSTGDVSFNGTVGYGTTDFGTFYEVFGVVAVPEPSTWVGAGLLSGLAVYSLRRRRAMQTA